MWTDDILSRFMFMNAAAADHGTKRWWQNNLYPQSIHLSTDWFNFSFGYQACRLRGLMPAFCIADAGWGFYSSFEKWSGGRIWLFPHPVLSAYKLIRQRRIVRRSIIVQRWKQLRVKMQWAFHIPFRQLSPHRSTVTETETRRPQHTRARIIP